MRWCTQDHSHLSNSTSQRDKPYQGKIGWVGITHTCITRHSWEDTSTTQGSSTDIGKLRLEVEGLKKDDIRLANTILKKVKSIKTGADSSHNELVVTMHTSYSNFSKNVELTYKTFYRNVLKHSQVFPWWSLSLGYVFFCLKTMTVDLWLIFFFRLYYWAATLILFFCISAYGLDYLVVFLLCLVFRFDHAKGGDKLE